MKTELLEGKIGFLRVKREIFINNSICIQIWYGYFIQIEDNKHDSKIQTCSLIVLPVIHVTMSFPSYSSLPHIWFMVVTIAKKTLNYIIY
jgi:hypothetical protein